jgi:hypothetical protein
MTAMNTGPAGLGHSFKTKFKPGIESFDLARRLGVHQMTHPVEIEGASPS